VLILTRKVGEWIKVGDVKIYVKQLKGSIVVLGVEAPSSMRIERLDSEGRIHGATERRQKDTLPAVGPGETVAAGGDKR
jgi:carbon storage regulator CsrA